MEIELYTTGFSGTIISGFMAELIERIAAQAQDIARLTADVKRQSRTARIENEARIKAEAERDDWKALATLAMRQSDCEGECSGSPGCAASQIYARINAPTEGGKEQA